MQEVMAYSKSHPAMSLNESLNTYVQMTKQQINQFMQQGPANAMMLQQVQQQGPNRMVNGPVFGQPMAMSPAMQASLLPGNVVNGSPRVASGPPGLMGQTHSPSMSGMAPPMSAQRSQQGSAAGASTSSSPNLPNKRRRSTQAAIKGEDDVSGVNGTATKKVKPSPQLNKRGKQ